MQQPEGPQRFIIRVSVQDIPGDPLARPFTLCEKFCQDVLQRSARLEVCDDGFDAVHIPPSFDSEEDVRIWFMVDTGVKGKVRREDVHKIPLKAYLGRLDDDHNLWVIRHPNLEQLTKTHRTFTPRTINDQYVKSCSKYTWGAGELSGDNEREGGGSGSGLH
jgi:hypothetical protein